MSGLSSLDRKEFLKLYNPDSTVEFPCKNTNYSIVFYIYNKNSERSFYCPFSYKQYKVNPKYIKFN